MNNQMDRRGFLKAMLVIAGSLVAPSLVSAGPRESVYVPKVKKITVSEYGRAVPFTEESANILSRFDPDDPIQVELRQQVKSTFQWMPDVPHNTGSKPTLFPRSYVSNR